MLLSLVGDVLVSVYRSEGGKGEPQVEPAGTQHLQRGDGWRLQSEETQLLIIKELLLLEQR